jgi:hypothetical protein
MAISVEEFDNLKRRVEKLQSERDKAAGVLEQLKEQLKKEFGLSSIKEAKALLRELEHEREEAEKQFNKDLKAFEKEWEERDG